jgi:DNA (cytosine-5)-methyltransferase 1
MNVAELFAGVGGFRVGLERAASDFVTTFSSQWEPPGSPRRQFASNCYQFRFGAAGHVNEDIARVLDEVEHRERDLGDIDILVGGFPCQDYSVAKPLNQSGGLEGKKGVLWWQIYRIIRLLADRGHAPEWLVLENVDRLLKSPATQRGRDFAIMLASLSDLGYDVEWRVINAADYGFPQKRRRVFIVATRCVSSRNDGTVRILSAGVLARAFPVERPEMGEHFDGPHFTLNGDLATISREFGRGVVRSEFLVAGFVSERKVWTLAPAPQLVEQGTTLGDIIQPLFDVPKEFHIEHGALARWKYAKGSKSEHRVNKKSGTEYFYTEGALPFPDPLNRQARTILTSEGGSTPTRSKHIIQQDGVYRRLTPIELERLNGFPDDWTNTGMSDSQRAFCMGNALVVGLVERIGRVIAKDAGLRVKRRNRPEVAAGSAVG